MNETDSIFEGIELVGVASINFDRVVKIIFIKDEGVLFFKEKGISNKLFFYKDPSGGAMVRFTEEEFLAIAKMYSFSGGLIAIEGLEELKNLSIAMRLDDPDTLNDQMIDEMTDASAQIVFKTQE